MQKSQLLECGKIVGVHGIMGELKLKPWGDDAEHLCEFSRFFESKTGREIKVLSIRTHKDMVLLKIEGVNTREQAEAMRGTVLCIDRADDSLENGQYYWADILGLTVKDIETSEIYGTIVDITDTGANLVYHIKNDSDKILLIPAIPLVVKEISLAEKNMKIKPLDGLFD